MRETGATISVMGNLSVVRRASFAIAAVTACGLLLGTAACTAAPTDAKLPSTTAATPRASPTPKSDPAPAPTPEPQPPTFDATAHSIDDPMSLWIVANKLRQLKPAAFEPTDLVYPQVDSTNGQPLREPAARAVEQMVAAASAEGIYLRLISAYRSYDTQVSVYGSFVANQGQAFADTTSARPGHSEHQTGLTADFDAADGCTLDGCFANTPSGLWLHTRAAEFGFVERYPLGKEHITGYMAEPWHYRYVGTELALEMRTQGVLTLEEFFGLPAAPDYAY